MTIEDFDNIDLDGLIRQLHEWRVDNAHLGEPVGIDGTVADLGGNQLMLILIPIPPGWSQPIATRSAAPKKPMMAQAIAEVQKRYAKATTKSVSIECE